MLRRGPFKGLSSSLLPHALCQACRCPGHAALHQIKLLRVEGCSEGWIQNFQALGRESNLPGSITHVYDKNTRGRGWGKRAVQRQRRGQKGRERGCGKGTMF